MFGHKKSQKAPEDGVKAVCGYKDSKGRFWETYEEAVESTEKFMREKEEREMVKELTNYAKYCGFQRSLFDMKLLFTEHSKGIYDIMHKHYGKEGL